jgi:LuxR family transcriptional regulator, maltose regulon positive regulatory protein
VVTVVAPAGYGKTTLLRQWMERDPRPFAWVTLHPAADDPTVLLSYIAVALDRVEPLDAGVFQALRAPHGLWSTALPRLSAAFATGTTPLVLVLDDLHRLTGRDALDAVSLLCQHVPTGSSLVLASRTEPPVGIARLRSQRTLGEIGPDALRLESSEAAELVRYAGAELALADIEDLTRRTEGWAAGLYLAALALRSGAPAATAGVLGGQDRFISDYFREEVLSRLDPDDLDFLTATSALARMSGPLCDAVLGRTGSAAALERLERSNLFVVPLDRQRKWYRYHHLFRDLLRSELRRAGLERYRALSRRASTWTAENGDLETAIWYAEAAEDLDLLADLIQAAALPTYHSGRIATIHGWLHRFDDEALLERYVPLAVIGGMVHLLTGSPEASVRWSSAADRAAEGYTGFLFDRSQSVTAWTAVLRALAGADGPARMRADAERALEGLAADSPWRATALTMLAAAHRLLGGRAAADAGFRDCVELALSKQLYDTAVHALGQRALLALEDGEARAAAEHLALARSLPGAPLGSYLTHAITLAASARLAIATGEPGRAREDFMRCQGLRPILTWAVAWNAVQVRLELARVALALTDIDGCRTLMGEIARVIERRPDVGVLLDDISHLTNQLTEFDTSQGRWASSLTAAELRLLPMLATHWSFQEIAERLFVSRNTVKTQGMSIYRKLGVSSRGDAIAAAADLGLLDASVLVVPRRFTPEG